MFRAYQPARGGAEGNRARPHAAVADGTRSVCEVARHDVDRLRRDAHPLRHRLGREVGHRLRLAYLGSREIERVVHVDELEPFLWKPKCLAMELEPLRLEAPANDPDYLRKPPNTFEETAKAEEDVLV